MSCAETCPNARTLGQSQPDEGLQGELAQQVSERQAAVAYLEAARLTADVVVRERCDGAGRSCFGAAWAFLARVGPAETSVNL